MTSSKKVTDIKDANKPKEIEWIPVTRVRTTGVQSDLDLLASFAHVISKKGTTVKKFTFRLAAGLMKKIGIEDGEKILLCYDKDDQRNMMLLKHDKGYSIVAEVQSKISPYRVSRVQSFDGSWCVLPAFKNERIAYKVDDQKRIIFRVEV